MSEAMWMERAQAAEAQLTTMREAKDAAINRVKEFKTNFGIREKQGGVIEIDYDKFAQALGVEGCLELRKVIDETHNISGAAGKKPRLKVASK